MSTFADLLNSLKQRSIAHLSLRFVNARIRCLADLACIETVQAIGLSKVELTACGNLIPEHVRLALCRQTDRFVAPCSLTDVCTNPAIAATDRVCLLRAHATNVVPDEDNLDSDLSCDELEAPGFLPEDCSSPREVDSKHPLEDRASSPTRRSDFPKINSATSCRGSLSLALSAARQPNNTLDIFRHDIYSSSSQKPRDSLWNTWCRIAATWQLPPLPVTSELIEKIGASLKAGGYKSAENYFCRAKDEHISQLRIALPPDVPSAIKKATRSIKRGAMAAKLKKAFRIELARSQPSDINLQLWKQAPAGAALAPIATIIMGCWFLTRGIELAAIRLVDVRLCKATKTVTITLPASKTDTAGKGVSRTHGCCCNELATHSWHNLCPYCIMTKYIKTWTQAFPEHRETWPLFCDRTGCFLSKSAVIQAVRSSVQTFDADAALDEDSFAEHSMRVSGAQMLARCGVDVHIIMLLGRWGSQAILRYIQEAPLLASAELAGHVAQSFDFSNKKARTSATPPVATRVLPEEASDEVIAPIPPAVTTVATKVLLEDASVRRTTKTTESIENFRDRVATACSTMCLPMTAMPIELRLLCGEDFILNERTKCCHRIRGNESGPSNMWTTRCGWTYFDRLYSKCKTIVGEPCPTCFQKPLA
jgi:hypothetical protein